MRRRSIQNVIPGDIPVSSLYVQAESGELGAEWIIETDPTYGDYVRTGNFGRNLEPSETVDNIIKYTVNLQAGVYNIYIHQMSPTGSDNSFHWRVNGGAWTMYGVSTSYDGIWRWEDILGVTMNEGLNTFEIHFREDSQRFDRFYFTKNGDQPAII